MCTCGNIVLSAADLMGGAENLGDSGDVGWEELVSDAPPTTLSFGDSGQKSAHRRLNLQTHTLKHIL